MGGPAVHGPQPESECPLRDAHKDPPVSRTDGGLSHPGRIALRGRRANRPQPEGDPPMRPTFTRLALLAAIVALFIPALAGAKATPAEITSSRTKGVEYL